MKFGYTILYVPDVEATVAFYERAFGLKRRFVHESGQYGELETGDTALAFASHELGAMNLPEGYTPSEPTALPLGFEIAFITEDVASAFAQAVEAGAQPVAGPKTKPWGQVVAYVRDSNGALVEIGSPMG